MADVKLPIIWARKSDAYFHSGLHKSAFRPSIYGGLPLDNYLPGISETYEFYKIRAKESRLRMPKFYMTHDAFMMHYRPYPDVLKSLRKKKQYVWQYIVENIVKHPDFMKLNEVTRGSTELAAIAAARLLEKLLLKVRERHPRDYVNVIDSQTPQQPQSGGGGGTVQDPGSGIVDDIVGGRQHIGDVINEVKSEVEEFKRLKEEGSEAAASLGGAGGDSYVHDALSAWKFLENPDKFRKRVSILRWAAVMMREFTAMMPTSLQHQQQVSLHGGISGVTRMLTESQLRDIVPSELAALGVKDATIAKILRYDLMMRLLSKQVTVYQRMAAIKPVVFVDKSGSMAEYFDAGIPKISVAAGFALAIYKKLQGEVYLFDTEVEKVRPAKVVETLLTIDADGGTNISEVFSEILRIGKKEYVYIVITDAIEEPDENLIDELERQGLLKRVKFIIVPPAWEKDWLRRFWYRKVTDITGFKRAAIEAVKNH